MSTYLQLVQQLYRELRLAGTVPLAVTSQAGQKLEVCTWIAEADYQIQTLWSNWNFLWSQWTYTTTADTANYTNASTVGMWDTESFYLDYDEEDYVHLTYIPYRQWRKTLRNGDKTSSTPHYVTILPDKSITLEPPPDSVFTITADFWVSPTKMTADSDTSEIPVKFERIILARAKMMYGETYGDTAIMQSAGAEYAMVLNLLQGEELPNRPDTLSETDLAVR